MKPDHADVHVLCTAQLDWAALWSRLCFVLFRINSVAGRGDRSVHKSTVSQFDRTTETVHVQFAVQVVTWESLSVGPERRQTSCLRTCSVIVCFHIHPATKVDVFLPQFRTVYFSSMQYHSALPLQVLNFMLQEVAPRVSFKFAAHCVTM